MQSIAEGRTEPSFTEATSRTIIPALADNVDLHTAAYQWLQRRVLSGRLDARHAAIWKVAHARAEAKTQHPTL